MTKHMTVRELSGAEVILVSGGLSSYDDEYTGSSYQSSFPSFSDCFGADNIWDCFSDWWNGADEIIINGSIPDGIDLGNGHELVTFNDGVRSLYIEGEWFANVELTGVSITNGSPSLEIGKDSIKYGANDGATYTFKTLPGR